MIFIVCSALFSPPPLKVGADAKCSGNGQKSNNEKGKRKN